MRKALPTDYLSPRNDFKDGFKKYDNTEKQTKISNYVVGFISNLVQQVVIPLKDLIKRNVKIK